MMELDFATGLLNLAAAVLTIGAAAIPLLKKEFGVKIFFTNRTLRQSKIDVQAICKEIYDRTISVTGAKHG